MSMTATDLFDVKVPTLFADHPEKVERVGVVYLFKILGAGGGTWTVDLAAGTPTCVKGDTGKAKCTAEISNTDFNNLVANPGLGMQLYFQGKLKVHGDITAMTKLKSLFALLA